MAMACGFRVSKMTIKPSEAGRGHVVWQAPDPPTDESQRRCVLVLVSGMVADFIHWAKWGQGEEDDAPGGHFNDQMQARGYLSALGEGDLFEAYMVQSKRFLERVEVWAFVCVIAELLLKIGSVDGQDFISGIAEKCPKFGDDEWAQLESVKTAVRTIANNDGLVLGK